MLGWRDEAYYQSDPWRGSWKGEDGGVLVNQAPHQLDLLQWYMGPVEEVFGYWSNLNHPYIEVEDTAVAVIKFKNGGLGNVIVSNSGEEGRKTVEIFTAIYRSNRDRIPVIFPLKPENKADFDGRLKCYTKSRTANDSELE